MITRSHRKFLKGIIFDLDGVIADTEDLHRQAYNLAFRQYNLGVEWSVQDYKDRLILSAGTKIRSLPGFSHAEKSEEFVQSLYRCKRDHYLRLLQEAQLPPRPGVVELILSCIDNHILLAAASTCAKEGALAILNHTLGPALVDHFQSIKAGDDAPRRKPAPDIYLLAITSLGLPTDSLIAIEDSVHGLQAAKAAGLWTLVTPSEYTLGGDFSSADLLVDNLSQVSLDLLDDHLRHKLTKEMGVLPVNNT